MNGPTGRLLNFVRFFAGTSQGMEISKIVAQNEICYLFWTSILFL